MENYSVEFLQIAIDDLEEIVLYIAKDSVQEAMKMHDEIANKSKKLSTFPKLGREVPDQKMRKMGFRMLAISSYIAFYRVIDKKIYIYRVLHGRRNYPILSQCLANRGRDK